MTKSELIRALVQDDIVNIESGEMSWWLESILLGGFKGYQNQSITELQQEYNERELQNQLAKNN
jgi:hypothetical protein